MDNGNFGRGQGRMNQHPIGPLRVGDYVTPVDDFGMQAPGPVGEITHIDARHNATVRWFVGRPSTVHVSQLARAPDGSERR